MIWLGYLVGQALGWTGRESLFCGAIVAISSTMIVAKVFAEQRIRGKLADLAFGVLVVEDLAAVLLLALLTTVSTGGGSPEAHSQRARGGLADSSSPSSRWVFFWFPARSGSWPGSRVLRPFSLRASGCVLRWRCWPRSWATRSHSVPSLPADWSPSRERATRSSTSFARCATSLPPSSSCRWG